MAKTGPQDQHRYRSDLLTELKHDVDHLAKESAGVGDAAADPSATDHSATDHSATRAPPQGTVDLPPMRRAEDRALYGSDPYLIRLARARKDDS
jgi:hypothetical protein